MDCQMNKFVFVAMLVAGSNTLSAQTFNEWFRQKKTQKEYLMQQIAALKVYLGYLKEGYNIAKKGLNTIGDIKQGKFDLDRTYLESLGNVNSAISGSGKVASIIAYQKATIIEFRKLKERSSESELLTPEEKQYVSDVYSNMLRESELSIQELERVLSDSDFEMKDDERVERLDMLYIDMKDKYSFTKAFSNSTRLLIAQRSKESHEIVNHESLMKEL
jgi:hypothetical protein